MATAGVIAVGLLLAGAALRSDTGPAPARLRSVLWLLSTASAAAFVAVLTGRYLHLADADRALTTSAASLVFAVPLWWRDRSVLQHLAAFGTAIAVLVTGIDRLDPRAGTFPFGIAIWVFALAWGIAVSRGRLVPAPVGTLLSGAGALAGAIIAMDHSAGVLLAIATVAGLFAGGVLMHQVRLIGIGAAGTLYVVPRAAARYLPGSVAAPQPGCRADAERKRVRERRRPGLRQVWARSMADLLIHANAAATAARAAGQPRLCHDQLAKISAWYRAAPSPRASPTTRESAARSPATALEGLADFAVVQSYLSTASKWGISKLDALRQLFTTGPWRPPATAPP
jgi:hypothetical protein